MSTFSKLSLIAQYDDFCRILNTLIDDSVEEEQASAAMLDGFDKLWHERERSHVIEKEELTTQISTLKREIKKLNRQLSEARSALVRETDEKKSAMKEKKALIDHMAEVKRLIESKDVTSDAQRRRVIRCLDIERLSPIQSDESDDCLSGLDYDKTEDDIMEPIPERRRKSSNIFDDALENLHNNNEQPTLLYRYLDKEGVDNFQTDEQPRRSSRRASGAATRRQSNYGLSGPTTTTTTTSSSNANHRDKYDQNTETDSNGMETTDENDIEFVRQQLKRAETVTATPSAGLKAKSATISRSAASLMKTVSNVASAVPNTNKPHTFVRKKSFRPDSCGPCGGKIPFYGSVSKCEVCGIVSHPDCREKCPLPCVKITAPTTRSRSKKILVSDYVNNDAIPKVPAIIVHSCNEIEREENITTEGLYRVVARTSDIEDLQDKILKSKSGMPNLSKVDVHLLTGVVKRFLQSLDESLITTTLWSHFSEATRLDTNVERRTHMSVYISDLPTANRDTLAFLMQHLHAVANRSDENKMTTANLAKTLAPTIVGNSCRNPTQGVILTENKIQIAIMETLFDIEESFWSNWVHKSPPPKSSSSSLGSRLLATPGSSSGYRTRNSRLATLPTPKVKPLFSR